MPTTKITFCTLTDFAMGNLSPEASQEVIRELERNPQASKDLELVLMLIDYFKREQEKPGLEQEPGS
jgi:hypothetical protein